MTKIVCISDTHGYHRNLKVPYGDILVHAGDCTDDAGQAALRDFLQWMHDQPHEHKVLIAGNHDWAFEKWPDQAQAMVKAVAPSVHYLQDSGVTLMGLKFWGSPMTPRFLDWAFNRDRGPDIRRHWDMIPNDIDVLVTHGPPFGHLDLSNNWNVATGKKFDDHLGCMDLEMARARVRPRLHVFGHIHGSGGKVESVYHADNDTESFLVNASIMDEAYIPNHKPVVIELFPDGSGYQT